MKMRGITWTGESVEDVEILPMLPGVLVNLLSETNGFILHHGALHVHGACLASEWHSLRSALYGPNAFRVLYNDVKASDIPFAQDQVGDQFLLRDAAVLRLDAETGRIEPLARNLEDFLNKVNDDIESFLNVGLSHKMQPGLHAFPPFCFRQSGGPASLAPVPASEVILFHADLARRIRDLPDGGQVEFKVTE